MTVNSTQEIVVRAKHERYEYKWYWPLDEPNKTLSDYGSDGWRVVPGIVVPGKVDPKSLCLLMERPL